MPELDLRKTRREKLEAFRKNRFETVFSAAESALKSAFLVNGGGAVALIAFLGQAARQGQVNPSAHLLAFALLVLVIGTALAGLATGLSFLAQYGYFMRRSRSWFGKAARSLTVLNIVFIGLSYVCFVTAGVIAFFALS